MQFGDEEGRRVEIVRREGNLGTGTQESEPPPPVSTLDFCGAQVDGPPPPPLSTGSCGQIGFQTGPNDFRPAGEAGGKEY